MKKYVLRRGYVSREFFAENDASAVAKAQEICKEESWTSSGFEPTLHHGDIRRIPFMIAET